MSVKKERTLRGLGYALGIGLMALALSACGGSSGGGSKALQLQGGNGGANGGSGGSGDSSYALEIDTDGAGDVIIGGGGNVDASFSPFNLDTLLTELGDNPLVVSADLDVATIPSTMPEEKPAAGVVYLRNEGLSGGSRLMISDGDTLAFNLATETVTGVHIRPDATLRLAPMSGEAVVVRMSHDLLIEGTLTTDDAGQAANIDWGLGALLIHSTGVIAQQGKAAGDTGGGVDFDLSRSFINHGRILTHGADNDAGDAGGGGDVYVQSEFFVENTGDIFAYGGESSAGLGGDAGYVNLYSYLGENRSSGKIHSYGGKGASGGGEGDDVSLEVEDFGSIRVSGEIWGFGGDAEDGSAGNADGLFLDTEGGEIHLNADVRLHGGSTESLAGNGGNGGDLDMDSNEDYFSCCEDVQLYGVFARGDRVNLSGGHSNPDGSGSGGAGGGIDIEVSPDDTLTLTDGPLVRLVGFGVINASGGTASFGGNGADIDIEMDNEQNAASIDLPPGNLTVRAAIDLSGGDVADDAMVIGYAGDGGDLDVEVKEEEASLSKDFGNITFTAPVDLSSGRNLNSTDYAYAGDVDVAGFNSVSMTSIDVSGGNDRGEDDTVGQGSHGGDVEIVAHNGPARTGVINANGGNALMFGGHAGDVMVEALTVAVGAISVNGGNADPNVAGSFGGDAGNLYLWAPRGPIDVSNGAWSSTAGTGETEGSEDRYVFIAGGCTGTGCSDLDD